MDEFNRSNLDKLKSEIEETVEDLDISSKKSKLGELKTISLKEGFWEDPNTAKKTTQMMDTLKDEIETAENLQTQIDNLIEIYDSVDQDEREILADEYHDLFLQYSDFQIYKYLSGKHDRSNAILTVYAGQGGTEANDWAQMLFRMYTRYCENNDFKFTVQDMQTGTETGISTATILIEGPFAYGKLKQESGTHRLVRLSPFNSQNLRQTSFAGVEVLPELDDDDEIIIEDKDLEFKAVRSSGAGGQSVNKTSSAVQITHIPSGITVHNSEHKNQAQNREAAMRILRSRLWRVEEEKRQQELAKLKGEHKAASWGNQIRNYVLHPYKLVKDLRTGIESNQPEQVLDGGLGEFIDAQIRIR